MKTRLKSCVLALALALPALAPASAQAQAPDCAALVGALGDLPGYRLEAPPLPPDPQGWCVFDGARLLSDRPGLPSLAADRLRLRLTETAVEVELRGLRARADPADRQMDDRLRGLIRLQAADLTLTARHDPMAGIVRLDQAELILTSGATLRVTARVRAGGLSPAALAAGRLEHLRLVWRNDGRVLRPVLELLARDMPVGDAALEAGRAVLLAAVAALPGVALTEDSRRALERLVADLPQGRGTLTLTLTAEDGIGAPALAAALLGGDPFGPVGLERLLSGATLTADWRAGLAP
jgi:hypothetical protein